MQNAKCKRQNFGFTLIELLIVIAIIAILAAVMIGVINPRMQRRRAREGVAIANLNKACQALVACQSSLSTYNTARCDSWAELGVEVPTQPTGVTWANPLVGGVATGDSGYVELRVTMDYAVTGATLCQWACRVNNDFTPWQSQSPGMVVNDLGACYTQ